MSVTLSFTQTDVYTTLRAFLLSILPSGTEVVRGQTNKVPEPASLNFVVMIPLMRNRLETTTTAYTDNGTGSNRSDVEPTQFTVQLDFHGPLAGDNVQIFTTLFRSDYATTQFATSGFDITPLFHSEPRQAPFINGEANYEQKWTVDAEMQINPIVSGVVQSATAVTVGIKEVDAFYPA